MRRRDKRYFWFIVPLLGVFLVVVGSVTWQFWTWWQRQQPFDYGAPTPISAEQSMRDVVCEIRHELASLPQPLVAKHRYHGAWSEYKIGAGRFDWGPVHEIELTAAAREFSLSHSRVELIAALAPLLLDPSLGGRAAAILGGLPARSKPALRNTSALAAAVQSAQGGNPDAAIAWSPDFGVTRVATPLALYGLTNMGNRLERPVPRKYAGSFEARLDKLLTARSKLPMVIIGSTSVRPDAPVPPGRKTFEDLLAFAPTPGIDPRFQQFLDDHPRLDVLIAVFPLLHDRRSHRAGPLAELIWASQVQHRYWPLVVGNPLINGNPYEDFLRELSSELIAMCGED